jgi:tripartite-type tricarboxylate transporter receptor subunit TctC
MKKIALAALGLCASVSVAQADITLVVPYSAGGPTDAVARLIAPSLQEQLGETVIVENRPGASGMIGTTAVLKATPDGKTLVIGTQGQVLTQLVQKDVVTYDAIKDFTMVALVGELPSVLVVNNDLPVHELKDLIELSKTKSLHYASSGVGNSPHLAGVMIAQALGVEMGHVPYAGAAPAMVDVMAGNVDMIAADIAAVVEPVKAGQMRAIATLAPERSAALPDVPTSVEQGYPGLFTGGYYYFAGPVGMEPAERQKLEDAVIAAANSPKVAEKFKALGISPPGDGKAVEAILTSEFAKWGPLIDEMGISVKP